jgi:hypothetical protein
MTSRQALTDSVSVLAEHFIAFTRDHGTEPLYARMSMLVAERPPILQLLLAAPATQRVPTLLFAALQDRLLALAESGTPLPALAAYYPSLGGTRAPDDALPAALEHFVDAEAAALQETIGARTTQTNEVGRSVVLWPALADIARRHGGAPLALLDFGCSAGLNLSVDSFRICYRDAAGAAQAVVGPDDAEAPALDCRLFGGVPPLSPWRLAARLGVDRAPISLDDTRALRWLRACLWPSERARAARFEQALRQARKVRHPVQAADDGLSVLSAWLRGLPAGVTPVLFNSWVLAYFSPEELATHTERMHELIRDQGLVWLSAEDDKRLRAATGLQAPEPPAGSRGTPTWWSVSERVDTGTVGHRLLACSHPHGEWLAWQA